MNHQYFEQVKLLLKLLPLALENQNFGLKGGTAINLFFENMNRLSVDIDLAYLPIEDRQTTIKNIKLELSAISARVQSHIKNAIVETKYTKSEEAKNILVRQGHSIVKIEVNLVVRGALFPCINVNTKPKVQEIFDTEVTVQCLSVADVYGSKICACLDRQHPRDWYDVWVLLGKGGITKQIKKAFLLYLLSSKRPIAEMLDPQPLDQRILYSNELEGMSASMPDYSILSQVRTRTVKIIKNILSEDEKNFLLSFKLGNPQWEKSGINNLENYPAVKWKLFNIQKMSQEKHKVSTEKLKRVLEL